MSPSPEETAEHLRARQVTFRYWNIITAIVITIIIIIIPRIIHLHHFIGMERRENGYHISPILFSYIASITY